MANIVDYLDWFGDFDFDTVPFNEADNLILAELSYLDLSGCVPHLPGFVDAQAEEPVPGTPELDPDSFSRHSVMVVDAAACFIEAHPDGKPDDMGPLISPLTVQPLFRMATSGRRFESARVGCYVHVFDEPAHEQFAAFTAALPDGTYYVSFEGTDDTLVGWLEDCETSYKVVAAQTDALRYLELIARMTSGPLRVGGHSKGGNLAAYASAFCSSEVQDRIIEVWCNDSPGFVDEVVPLSSFAPIADRIRLYTVEYSVVGAQFDHVVEPVVVKSSGSGVMEHSAICWQVMRGSFVRGQGVTEGSKRTCAVFNQLIDSHDLAGRKRLLDDLYAGLTAAGVTRISQLFDDGAAGIAKIINSVNSLGPEDRQAMTAFLTGVMRSSIADAVEPVAHQISGAVAPVAHQIGGAVEPVAHQIGGAVEPMTKQIGDAVEVAREGMAKAAHDARSGFSKAVADLKAAHAAEHAQDASPHGIAAHIARRRDLARADAEGEAESFPDGASDSSEAPADPDAVSRETD